MSLVKKAIKKLGVDSVKAFKKWIDTAPKGKHKKIWEAYDKSISDIEIAELKFQTWIQQNWQKGNFYPNHANWDRQIMGLRKKSLEKLQAVFEAFKKDMKG